MATRRSAAFAVALSLAFAVSVGTPGLSAPTRSIASVRIVSSLPMQGGSAVYTQSIVNAIRLALAGIPAGAAVDIRYDALDDGDAGGNWQAGLEAANAQAALDDPSVVAYLGPFNSGAARVSIPILCAGGLVMVSPSNTFTGLTRPTFFGASTGCARNYARVIQTDDAEGGIAAGWAKSMGLDSVYLLATDDVPGPGVAQSFREEAQRQGLGIVGSETVPVASTYAALAARVAAAHPDLVFFAGGFGSGAVPGAVLRDLRQAGTDALFAGARSLLDADLGPAGAGAIGTIATFGSYESHDFTGRATVFRARYLGRYGQEPTSYSIYAYDAAKAVVAAILTAGERATDRQTVRDRVLATKHFNGALGCWSFDAFGDTTFATSSTMIFGPGGWHSNGLASRRPIKGGCGGGEEDDGR